MRFRNHAALPHFSCGPGPQDKNMQGVTMSGVLDLAVKAHGGLDRLEQGEGD